MSRTLRVASLVLLMAAVALFLAAIWTSPGLALNERLSATGVITLFVGIVGAAVAWAP